MDQYANLIDEGCQLSNADCLEDTPVHENREPVSSLIGMLAWLSRAKLQHNMASMT
jgi:hypothetical protein